MAPSITTIESDNADVEGRSMGSNNRSVTRTRVFIVDSEPVYRLGLATLLAHEPAFEVAGHVGTRAEAILGVVGARPDVVILDVSLDDGDGTTLIADILKSQNCNRFLVISNILTANRVQQTLAAGAGSYLSKRTAIAEILKALAVVSEGGLYLPPEIVRLSQTGPSHKMLTRRENELLLLVARGHTYDQMARLLGVQIETVKTHMKQMQRKFGKNSRTEVIAYGLKLGLIDPSQL